MSTILEQPQLLERYQLIREVGQGGMATVFLGKDQVLGRDVAVKILHPHLAKDVSHRQRFGREAKAVARLDHEGIVQIYDFSGAVSQEEKEMYLVMEFVQGVSLQEFLQKTKIPFPEMAACIVFSLLPALEHAHKQQIVHRDLKPENVMIRQDGRLKLTDFGLARLLDTESMTRTGAILGSPAYMAPEQVHGKEGDHRVDIFALGVLLYRLICNEEPFLRSNPAATLQAVSHCHFKDPELIVKGLGKELHSIIKKTLTPEPEKRYASVEDMRSALSSYLRDSGIERPSFWSESFFCKKESSFVEMQKIIVRKLKEKALQQIESKQFSSALDLCNRLLFHSPDDKDILALVDRIKSRVQWKKKWLFASFLLCVFVVLLGVYVLFQQEKLPDSFSKQSNQALLATFQKTTLPTKTRLVLKKKTMALQVKVSRLLVSKKPMVVERKETLSGTWGKWNRSKHIPHNLRWKAIQRKEGIRLYLRGKEGKIKLAHQSRFSSLTKKKAIEWSLRKNRPLQLLYQVHPKERYQLNLVLRPFKVRLLAPKTKKEERLPPVLGPPRKISLNVWPWVRVHFLSGKRLVQSKREGRFHFFSLPSNTVWKMVASQPAIHSITRWIKIPTQGPILIRESSEQNWVALRLENNVPTFRARASFRDAFLQISCKTNGAELWINDVFRTKLSFISQKIPIHWKDSRKPSKKIKVSIRSFGFKTWERVFWIRAGSRLSVPLVSLHAER